MIVVDTSVIVDLLRGKATPAVARLRWLADHDVPFAIPDVCGMEILQGARDEREWKVLLQYLGTQIVLSPRDPWALHVEAARIFFDCRRLGVTPRSAGDCVIAALVLQEGGALLHDDRDFEAIARVRPLQFALREAEARS